MRFATWNVNSVRARIGAIDAWIEQQRPDVLLLQETKCSDATFDTDELRGVFERRGYDTEHHGVNHYNGVAIASRVGLADVERGFTGEVEPPFDEPRLIGAVCGGIRFRCVYVPNGRKAHDPHWYFKLAWLERLRSIVDMSVPTVVSGDFNVQRADIDVYDPKRWRNRNHATPEERAAFAALVDLGLRDVLRERHPGPDVYTWWNYRPGQFDKNKGMRIDLALCTPDVADRVTDVWIDRGERARATTSDHAPVVFDLGPIEPESAPG